MLASMSLQAGKPWMIERSEFIESVNTWYRHSLAISNDATLSALVTLRLATADTLEVFNPQRPAPSILTHAYRFDPLLKTLTPQMEAWKQHWVRVTSDKERCHFFLVSFFGMHVLLVLYSFPLQASISSPIGASLVDIEAFWITYTSALEMLTLVSHPSLTPFLSFAHDSIHAMTAYAAAFLIKASPQNPAPDSFIPVIDSSQLTDRFCPASSISQRSYSPRIREEGLGYYSERRQCVRATVYAANFQLRTAGKFPQ